MINNAEKELLLKLLIEKATKADSTNLQLVAALKPKKRGAGRGRRPKGVKQWTLEDTNFLKQSLVAGKTHREIASMLDRTVKAVEIRRYLIRNGKVG